MRVLSGAVLTVAILACANSAAAQLRDDGRFTVGPLAGQLPASPEWKSGDINAVTVLARHDGIRSDPTLALAGPGGSVIYAIEQTFTDFYMSAEDMAASSRDPIANSFGLKASDVVTTVAKLPSGVSAAIIRAEGAGTGQEFVSKGKTRMVAIWATLPYVHKEGGHLRNGVVSFIFRGASTMAPAGEKYFQALVGTLAPRPEYPAGSVAEFEARINPKSLSTAQASPPPPAPVGLATLKLQEKTDGVLAENVPTTDSQFQAVSADLREFASGMPGNPLLRLRVERLESFGREAIAISKFLAEDPQGTRVAALRAFHEKALAQLRGGGDVTAVREYARYLAIVWPGNPVLRPPSGAKTGDSWMHPLLGIKMSYLGGQASGFWSIDRPLLETPDLPGYAHPIPIDSAGVARYAKAYEVRFPTESEYRLLARTRPGALAKKGIGWAASDEPAEATRLIEIKTGKGDGLDVRTAERPSTVSFFAVLSATPASH